MKVRRRAAGLLFFVLAAPALAAGPRSSLPPQPVGVVPESGGERVLARASSEQAAPASPSPAASGASSPLPSASPAAAASAELTAKARAEFDQDRTGKLDRTRYGSELNGVITDGLYTRVSAQLHSLGEVRSFTPVSQTNTHGITVYVYRIECAKPPAVEQTIGWDASGKIVTLGYHPARG